MEDRLKKQFAFLSAGLCFAILWPSAATATKIGLQALQPFVICVIRFFIAGLILLAIAHLLLRYRLPRGKEWGRLMIYGILSNTVYLGLYVLAMRQVSAGLGSLAVAINPVLIHLLTSIFLRRPLSRNTLFSLVICMSGVILAAWPLLRNASSTPAGLLILLTSMVAYSIGVFYFSRTIWKDLSLLVINGWQVLFGGLFMIPLVLITYRSDANSFHAAGIIPVFWLAIPVSIVAVQLWLYLLRQDAARSSFWLFLCPVFGFVQSNVLTHEPLSLYTLGGLVLVLGGLFWQQIRKNG